MARTYGTCVLLQRNETVQITNDPGRRSAQTAANEHHDDSPRKDLARSTGMLLSMMSEATAAAARQREGAQEEVALLTMNDFGPRVRVRIGGLVTARSVKCVIVHGFLPEFCCLFF